jgi:hypothetical protein
VQEDGAPGRQRAADFRDTPSWNTIHLKIKDFYAGWQYFGGQVMPPTQLGFYPCWKRVSSHIFAFSSPSDSVRRTLGAVKGDLLEFDRDECATTVI